VTAASSATHANAVTLIATCFTSKAEVREWITDPGTVLKDLKAFTIEFNVDLHDMAASHMPLSSLLERGPAVAARSEASIDVLIITFMMTSCSSSAYGSSFHGSGSVIKQQASSTGSLRRC
jgi:hypothetical protein